MTHTWKRLASGKYVDLNNLCFTDLNIDDVDVSLNNIIRFTGHYKDESPLTVAQHSNLCLRLAQMDTEFSHIHLATLIHDFSESLIGDVVSPVKKAMGQSWLDFAKPIEKIFDFKFFGGDIIQEVHEIVKIYDLQALDIERRVMWSSQYGKDKWPPYRDRSFGMHHKQELFEWAKKTPPNLKENWDYLYRKVNG